VSERGWIPALAALWAGLAGCGFDIARGITDAPVPDVPDVPPDMATGRVKPGLIGFWTFDDPPGSMFLADTSGAGTTVPIEVYNQGGIPAPMIANGNLVANVPVRLYTAENSRLAADAVSGGGATLEIWVMPRTNFQGASGEPAFIVGLAANVASRDIALLQDGDKWVGLARTTGALDGSPRLVSSSSASSTAMTHLVLTASPSQRILYVDSVPQVMGTAGPLTGWDLTYPLALLDEYQHARQWTGTVALVALYNRGLSAPEIARNFALGPDAPP